MTTRALLYLSFLLTLVVSGCSAPADATDPPPTGDVLSSVAKDDAIAALLPERVRTAGTLRFGSSIGGQPPSSFYAEDNRTPLGHEIDVTDAVARVLGVRVDRTEAAFEAILPALGTGKFDVGTGNFGVTDARRATIDFVTYINDGQGFAVRADDKDLPEVKDLKALCGHIVGTGAGTTFEATLDREKHVCADAGKPPYEVKVFSETGALYLALQQRHIDVIMSTINGLRHAAKAQPTLRFLNEYKRLDVGFAFAKGSDLTPAFQAAVNKLIKDGTYKRILDKWGTQGSAIPSSEISPPEHH